MHYKKASLVTMLVTSTPLAYPSMCGVYSTDALQPSLVPHFDFTTMAMNDGMHGEGDGVLREEEYQMIYMITRVYQWADFNRINALKRGYPWRPGEEPPDLHGSIQQGATGNVPTKGACVRFSASQTLRWAKNSPAFLKPIIQDPEAPFWKCWLKHVEYLNVMLQFSFGESDPDRLDILIYEHQAHHIHDPTPTHPLRARVCRHVVTSCDCVSHPNLLGTLRPSRAVYRSEET